MANYTHIKNFVDFKGLDLRSSLILTPRGFARKADNCAHTPEGGLTCRRGAKIVQSGAADTTRLGYGTFRLDTTDILGNRKSELLSVGYNGYLYRVTRRTFTITNTTGASITVSMYYIGTELTFRVQGASTLVSQGLGTGNEGSPYNMTSLETVVDAVSGLAMSTPVSAPAAFMDIIPDVAVANGATGTFYYTTLEQVQVNGFGGQYYLALNPQGELGNDKFEPASGCVINGVLYVSSGSNAGSSAPAATIGKYDGQRYYRAGMKRGFEASLIADVAGAALTDAKGARTRTGWASEENGYLITYKQVDKTGQVVENLNVPRSGLVSGSGGFATRVIRVDLTPPDSTTLRSQGFNDAHAIVNGAQASVSTITVDSGHDFVAGDIAYFWDESQDRWIQREITSVTSTTITISTTSLDSNEDSPNYDDGGVVSVNDNAVISANLRVCIWRLDATGQIATLVEEIAYITHSGTYQYFYDEGPGFDFGGEYVQPAYEYMSGCPQGRYVCAFNNQLIVAGNDKRGNTVFFSDIESPELFSPNHEFDVQTRVTGCHQTAEVLCIGEQASLNIVSGDLANFQFRVDKIGTAIGVVSHHSMKEVQEGVMPFLSAKGPYVLIGGRQLEPIGGLTYSDGAKVSRIEPVFAKVYDQTASHPAFRRATAGVLSAKSLYVLFVPFEDASAYGFANSDSVAYVFDYGRGTWFKWTDVNMAGGIAELEETLWWTGRAYDGAGSYDLNNALSKLYQLQPETKGKYAYGDHDSEIDWDYRSSWEHLGKPGMLKRFLRNRISSHEARPASSVTFTMSTYVDFDEATESFTTDLTFTTEQDKKVKIKAENCRGMQVRFQQSVRYDPMIITGYELEAVAAFRQEFRE